jgi:uncharacterized protein (DUF362 family)
MKDLIELELPEEAEGFRLERRGGKSVAVEKRRDLVDAGARVFISRMGDSIPADVSAALERAGASEIIRPGQMVAIKVNLGGGVAEVPSSFSDPLVIEGVIDKVRDAGGIPFVCEANMRSLTMTQGLLARRALYPLLVRKGARFVNLSELPGVDYFPAGWQSPVHLPLALLHPDVRVISVPALKHHWECGVTLAGRNMYGAIGERQKSLFHLLGHRQVGARLGPHFCVPVDFGYIVASDSVLAADRVGCDFMGTDWRKVKHIQINTNGRQVPYRLVEGSVEIDKDTKRRISRLAPSPSEVWFWRAALYPQYFVPHGAQHRQIPKLETLGTWSNWLLFHPWGDPWPSAWRARWKPPR